MSNTISSKTGGRAERQTNLTIAAWLAIALGCVTMVMASLLQNRPELASTIKPWLLLKGMAELLLTTPLLVLAGAVMITAGIALLYGLSWGRLFFLCSTPVYVGAIFLAGATLTTWLFAAALCVAIGVIVMLPESRVFLEGSGYLRSEEKEQIHGWLTIFALIAVGYWCYLTSLAETIDGWESPQYSHGYLIPLFAAVLLWLRRESFGNVPVAQRWWGVGLVALGTVMRLGGVHYYFQTIDRISFIPCLIGIFVMVGGLRTIRWAAPPLGFLIFMYQLPGFMVDGILQPMQKIASKSSLFVLQTLGVEAYLEGNVIKLDAVDMGVIDQCSGLRMLTIFVALAFAIAMIATTRPWWERIVIVLSAVPIALAVNIIRISMTGVLYSLDINQEFANTFFHDLGGLIMMPMALGLLYLEFQILSQIIIDASSEEVIPVGIGVPRQHPRQKGSKK